MRDPLEDRTSPLPSRDHDGSLFLNYNVAQRTVSKSSTARADQLSELCTKLHHAANELNRSNTRRKHSKSIKPSHTHVI